MTLNWLGRRLNHMFFVFTPKNVGSCSSTSSKDCAYTDYCAYHWYFPQAAGEPSSTRTSRTPTPRASAPSTGRPATRASSRTATGPTRRSTSRATSTTRRSPIPYGNAWYDSQGNENGDKCAWNFGTALGGSGRPVEPGRSTATTTTSSRSGTTPRAAACSETGAAASAAPDDLRACTPTSGRRVGTSGDDHRHELHRRHLGQVQRHVARPSPVSGRRPLDHGDRARRAPRPGRSRVTTPAGTGTSSEQLHRSTRARLLDRRLAGEPDGQARLEVPSTRSRSRA